MSVEDIEGAERCLLEGLNYEFICHHPNDTIKELAFGVSNYFGKDSMREDSEVQTGYAADYPDELVERAEEVAFRSLVFSDAPFLYSPQVLACATMALVLRSVDGEGRVGSVMRDLISLRLGSNVDINSFLGQVEASVKTIYENPWMDLMPVDGNVSKLVMERAVGLRDVLGKAANIRILRQMRPHSSVTMMRPRKRARGMIESTPLQKHGRKVSRVTPTVW